VCPGHEGAGRKQLRRRETLELPKGIRGATTKEGTSLEVTVTPTEEKKRKKKKLGKRGASFSPALRS